MTIGRQYQTPYERDADSGYAQDATPDYGPDLDEGYAQDADSGSTKDAGVDSAHAVDPHATEVDADQPDVVDRPDVVDQSDFFGQPEVVDEPDVADQPEVAVDQPDVVDQPEVAVDESDVVDQPDSVDQSAVVDESAVVDQPDSVEPATGTHVLSAEWQSLQGRFVDDPDAAVSEAAALVDEAIQRLLESLHDGASGEAGDVSTEQKRQAFQRYRAVHEVLSNT